MPIDIIKWIITIIGSFLKGVRLIYLSMQEKHEKIVLGNYIGIIFSFCKPQDQKHYEF